MAPPRLALDRLSHRDDGLVVYRFKKVWSEGTHAVVLSPADFLVCSCALVPLLRLHSMRYLGVLAGHSSLRAEVVPANTATPSGAGLDPLIPSTVQGQPAPLGVASGGVARASATVEPERSAKESAVAVSKRDVVMRLTS